MKKLIFLILLLTACSPNKPGHTQGRIVEMWSYNYGRSTAIKVFTESHGVINLYDSAYFTELKIGMKIKVVCHDMQKHDASNCYFDGLLKEGNAK